MFGAAAMSLSSFCVVSNALRLNWFGLHHDTKKVHKKTPASLPDLSAFTLPEEKTGDSGANWICEIRIEGMMCEHCEATVKQALESVEGVVNAEADYHKGIAIVTGTGSIPEDQIRRAVDAQDYTVLSIG